jgi:hypothetical protein
MASSHIDAYIQNQQAMRTTLDLPTPMLRDIKIQAAQAGVSMKTLLTQWIEAALRQPSHVVVSSQVDVAKQQRPLPTFVRPARPNAPVQPAMSNAQLNAVLEQTDVLRAMRNNSTSKP